MNNGMLTAEKKSLTVFDNTGYYNGDQGHSIMDGKNFSLEIELYLNAELATCAALMNHYDYNHLVELGCGALRMLGASMPNDAQYLGVDIRKEVDTKNKSFILTNELHRCRFVRAKAHRFMSLANRFIIKAETPKEFRHGLIVMPFNFVGNIHNLSAFLDSICDSRHDVFISQFSTSERAANIRSNYYASCGLDAEQESNEIGCVFWSKEGFSSYTYHFSYLDSLMSARGYLQGDQFANNIYDMRHYRPISMSKEKFKKDDSL